MFQISVYRGGAVALPSPGVSEAQSAVVNNSPVGCQSRDRAAHRRLSREQRD